MHTAFNSHYLSRIINAIIWTNENMDLNVFWVHEYSCNFKWFRVILAFINILGCFLDLWHQNLKKCEFCSKKFYRLRNEELFSALNSLVKIFIDFTKLRCKISTYYCNKYIISIPRRSLSLILEIFEIIYGSTLVFWYLQYLEVEAKIWLTNLSVNVY